MDPFLDNIRTGRTNIVDVYFDDVTTPSEYDQRKIEFHEDVIDRIVEKLFQPNPSIKTSEDEETLSTFNRLDNKRFVITRLDSKLLEFYKNGDEAGILDLQAAVTDTKKFLFAAELTDWDSRYDMKEIIDISNDKKFIKDIMIRALLLLLLLGTTSNLADNKFIETINSLSKSNKVTVVEFFEIIGDLIDKMNEHIAILHRNTNRVDIAVLYSYFQFRRKYVRDIVGDIVRVVGKEP